MIRILITPGPRINFLSATFGFFQPRRCVMLVHRWRANFSGLIDVDRAEGDNLTGSCTAETLQTHHIGDRRPQVWQGPFFND